MEAERKQKRENEVTMYRRYRIGDLPDIQIPHSAIIAPLQALAQVTHSIMTYWSSVYRKISNGSWVSNRSRVSSWSRMPPFDALNDETKSAGKRVS